MFAIYIYWSRLYSYTIINIKTAVEKQLQTKKPSNLFGLTVSTKCYSCGTVRYCLFFYGELCLYYIGISPNNSFSDARFKPKAILMTVNNRAMNTWKATLCDSK